ncbi:DUF29 domain-containing protein [Gammaproteobacteria bacterium]
MNTHETDFYSWTQEQASLLKQGRFQDIDIENLIEELQDMGRSERRELENRLAVLLAHLLKWQYQALHRGNSWEATIGEQRLQVHKGLRENPSLKPRISDIVQDAYDAARFQAMKETNLNLNTFPTECPWAVPQVLDNNFWPE